MFDVRYHIASLVAVFLALGVGILLGTVIVDKGVLVEQQKALVESVKRDINELRGENRLLGRELKRNEEFQGEIFPHIVEGRLEGKRITIIVTSKVSEEVQRGVKEALDQANAKSFILLILHPDFGLKRSDIRGKLSTFFPEEKLSRSELEKKVVEKLATELVTTLDSVFLTELANLGLIRISGELNLPVENVVLFGESQKKSEISNVDSLLIEQFKKLEIFVVGVETTDAKVSSIPAYKNAGITSVDNVDTIPGRVALILVLQGKAGNFGIKPTAEKLLPP